MKTQVVGVLLSCALSIPVQAQPRYPTEFPTTRYAPDLPEKSDTFARDQVVGGITTVIVLCAMAGCFSTTGSSAGSGSSSNRQRRDEARDSAHADEVGGYTTAPIAPFYAEQHW